MIKFLSTSNIVLSESHKASNMDNVYRLEVLKFLHSWHEGILPKVFVNVQNMFQYASKMHRFNTRYTTKQNFYKSRVKTNTYVQQVLFNEYFTLTVVHYFIFDSALVNFY